MTLRTRKIALKEAAELKRTQDPEEEFKEKVDAPLRKLEAQSLVFNQMFLDFLFKLSMLTVFYTVYYIYTNKKQVEVVGFHSITLVILVTGTAWLNELKAGALDLMLYSKYFRITNVLVIIQILIFLHIYLNEDTEIATQCIPLALVYVLVVVMSLVIVRRTSSNLRRQRQAVFKDE